MDHRVTDREVYPAAWITLAALGAVFLVWKYILNAPTVSACWFWEHWHVYCPGCGGTRAVMTLARGQILKSLHYHPGVPVTAALAAVYMASQTVWRLRGRQGWVLHYDPRWPVLLAALFLVHCVVRNVLWLGFGVAI